jgi:hypothetical protein
MTRNLLIFLLVCLVAFMNATAHGAPSFTGSWASKANGDFEFSLDLTQKGNRLEGYHTAVALHGRRIDAVLPSDGPPSVAGIISGGVAEVHFQSGYSDATGEATISLHGNKLEWKIIKSSGAHYLPESCVLYRQ